MSKQANPWPLVVKLGDLTRRLNALAGVKSADDTTVLLCQICRKPLKFCGCGPRRVIKP